MKMVNKRGSILTDHPVEIILVLFVLGIAIVAGVYFSGWVQININNIQGTDLGSFAAPCASSCIRGVDAWCGADLKDAEFNRANLLKLKNVLITRTGTSWTCSKKNGVSLVTNINDCGSDDASKKYDGILASKESAETLSFINGQVKVSCETLVSSGLVTLECPYFNNCNYK
jgi:hypothetical protein